MNSMDYKVVVSKLGSRTPRSGVGLRTMIRSGLAVFCLLAGSLALAQGNPGSCEGDKYRSFDFWLGDWEVHLADGTFAGNNSITSEQKGCVLVERWKSANGGEGMSINYYDAALEQWRQIWISPGIQIDIVGELSDGAMHLDGQIQYLNQETEQGFRGIWTPLDGGKANQRFEQEDEDGNWSVWFEGIYSPVNEAKADSESTE